MAALLERLPASFFRRYSWREGTGRKLSAWFAFFLVRIPNSDDPETLWLILERRDGAVRDNRAHLSSLPPETPRPRLIYLLEERWRTEAMCRGLKQELGLSHYEGRRDTARNIT